MRTEKKLVLGQQGEKLVEARGGTAGKLMGSPGSESTQPSLDRLSTVLSGRGLGDWVV